jgi:hypothetical protein
MCFVLYAGTTHPLPRRKFDKDSAELPVESLTNHDAAIRQHFASPEVQNIGSTSNCGCDFPHAMFQNGGWPEIDYQEPPEDELDLARAASERKNCQALADLLRITGDATVELYGVWDGDFSVSPESREDIHISRLTDPDFRFKERGFYKVAV